MCNTRTAADIALCAFEQFLGESFRNALSQIAKIKDSTDPFKDGHWKRRYQWPPDEEDHTEMQLYAINLWLESVKK